MPVCLSNSQDDRLVIAYTGVSVELTSHVVKKPFSRLTHTGLGKPIDEDNILLCQKVSTHIILNGVP